MAYPRILKRILRPHKDTEKVKCACNLLVTKMYPKIRYCGVSSNLKCDTILKRPYSLLNCILKPEMCCELEATIFVTKVYPQNMIQFGNDYFRYLNVS